MLGTRVWAHVHLRPAPVRNDAGRTGSAPLPENPVSLAAMEIRGDPNASIVLIVYSDFQCPFCGKFARETLPALESKYVDTGKVRLAFRHRPLTQIHPFAMKASEAAECARRQGKFWSMHDQLFSHQNDLDTAGLLTRARDVGLDERTFQHCLGGEATGRVLQDSEDAAKLGVFGTPAFMVGITEGTGLVKVTHRLAGALPIQRFEEVLDSLAQREHGLQ